MTITLRPHNAKVLIWTLILADMLSGLLNVLHLPFHRIGLLIKAIVILRVFFGYMPYLRQKTYLSIYTLILILLCTWMTGFVTTIYVDPGFIHSKIPLTDNFKWMESIVMLNRFLFILILSCAFFDWCDTDLSFENTCKNIFETFFIINNAIIFFGFLFKIELFSTYNYGEVDYVQRFGYKGLIYGQNEVAAMYTLGMAYGFRETFKYQRKKVLLLISTCFASLLLGTKAAWFTLILISLYYMCRYKFKTLVLLVSPLLVVVVSYINLNWDSFKERYLHFVIDKYNTMSFYSFWTSSRNDFLINVFNKMSNEWALVNFISGDASSSVEMDFFDLYFYFGVAGFFYIVYYTRVFFIKDRSLDNVYFFLVWMAMSFISGHIINSAIVPLFTLLYIFSISSCQKKLYGGDEKTSCPNLA